jgi:hypothetical protein
MPHTETKKKNNTHTKPENIPSKGGKEVIKSSRPFPPPPNHHRSPMTKLCKITQKEACSSTKKPSSPTISFRPFGIMASRELLVRGNPSGSTFFADRNEEIGNSLKFGVVGVVIDECLVCRGMLKRALIPFVAELSGGR